MHVANCYIRIRLVGYLLAYLKDTVTVWVGDCRACSTCTFTRLSVKFKCIAVVTGARGVDVAMATHVLAASVAVGTAVNHFHLNAYMAFTRTHTQVQIISTGNIQPKDNSNFNPIRPRNSRAHPINPTNPTWAIIK